MGAVYVARFFSGLAVTCELLAQNGGRKYLHKGMSFQCLMPLNTWFEWYKTEQMSTATTGSLSQMYHHPVGPQRKMQNWDKVLTNGKPLYNKVPLSTNTR